MEEVSGHSPSSSKTTERKDQLAWESEHIKVEAAGIQMGSKVQKQGPPLPCKGESGGGLMTKVLRFLGLEATVPQLSTMFILEG